MTAPILYNLLPGQYQIGSLVFGRGTTVPVETFEIKPYDVNAQDYQVARADEMRFGWDQLKPTTIEITFDVLINRLLPPYEDYIPNFWADMPTVAQFAKEWRGDDLRQMWGAMKPLYCCGRDGVTRAVYGRTGQFTYAKNTQYTETIQCLGEFRRADTLSYGVDEHALVIQPGAGPTVVHRIEGDLDCWLRVILLGPMTHPIITLGTEQIELNVAIEADALVEVSSYPWMRRVIDNKSENLTSAMIGKTVYLDRLKIPPNIDFPVRWTSLEASTMVPNLGNASWMEDIGTVDILHGNFSGLFGGLNRWNIPDTFNVINGQVVTRFNVHFEKFLDSAVYQNTSAITYIDQHFKTTTQYAEVKLSGVLNGKSAIVIMSDDDMTSCCILSVEAGSLLGVNNYLKIYSGSWDSHVEQASWHYVDLIGFSLDDVVGFAYDERDKTYTGYLNGNPVISWPDPTGIVSTDTAYRSMGYIFDMDGTLLTEATGFAGLISYDWLGMDAPGHGPGTIPGTPTGQVILLWRDAYSIVG